ncbi:MAG TPA: hypothetical protein VGK45_10330 [Thermoanaerobaculia bacterium]
MLSPLGDRTAEKTTTARWEWIAAIGLTVAVAALHAVRLLHAGGLWRDEAGAARLAMMPTVREIFGLFQHEAFPLLFPVTIRTWMAVVGGGDAALRAFGLLVGLALVGVLWWNARAWGTVPLVSLALLGLSVPVLIYGDSVRGYGLGSVLLLLMLGLLARALSPQAPVAVLAALPVVAVACVQVVLSNSALLGALCGAAIVVAAIRRRWGLAAWIFGSGALAALSLLPYAASLAAARQQWSMIVTYPIQLIRIWHGFQETVGPRLVLGGWLVLLGVGLAVALIRRQDPISPDRSLFAALTIVFALVADGVFLKTLGYRPRAWYYVPLMALLAGALDAVWARSGGRRLDAVRAAVVVLVIGAQCVPLWQQATLRQTNVDLVAARVAAAAAPDDLVVVNSWYYGVSFNRYYTGPARWLTLPDIPDHRVHRYDLLKARMVSRSPIDDVLATIAASLRSGHRVWLVGGADWPRPGETVQALPPAPFTSEGWHDWPYATSWSRQLGAYLENHAGQLTPVAVPVDGPVSVLENLPLVVVTGWRDEVPATSHSL